MSSPSNTDLDSDSVLSATARKPWVTLLSVAACALVFLGLSMQEDPESWEAFSRVGYLPGDAVWDGAWWSLVTSAFVHISGLHLVFNVYWLWILGSIMERAIGAKRFLAFFVTAAAVSSSAQLAVSDDTGYGASGVVSAIFGFIWIARERYPELKQVLSNGLIGVFLIWLAVCIGTTYLQIFTVGNAAHVVGLFFGMSVAGLIVVRRGRWLFQTALVVLTLLSTIPLFWCPWSVTWLSLQAFHAHESAHYEEAVTRYSQVIRIDPENAWAFLNRSYANESLGKMNQAAFDRQRVLEIDPSVETAE